MVIKNLTKSFSNKNVFNDLSLEFQSKQITCLLGPSGCGKSTLIRIILGLIAPDSGEVSFPIGKSVIFQEPRLLSWFTVLENILLGLENKNDYVTQAYQVLKEVKLDHAIHLYPHELSGGMKMRVSLARALMVNAELLICDEPFSALDESTRNEMQELLVSICKSHQITCIFVTHSISEALLISDRSIVFNQVGKIVYDRKSKFPEKGPEIQYQTDFLQTKKEIQQLLSGKLLDA